MVMHAGEVTAQSQGHSLAAVKLVLIQNWDDYKSGFFLGEQLGRAENLVPLDCHSPWTPFTQCMTIPGPFLTCPP